MAQHLVRQRAPKLKIVCVLSGSRSQLRRRMRTSRHCAADAQAMRTVMAHRPRRRLVSADVRSGLAVLGYEAKLRLPEAHQREGGTPVLPTMHQPFAGPANNNTEIFSFYTPFLNQKIRPSSQFPPPESLLVFSTF